VVEADEFDRSFLPLHPKAAIVTSMDADHLDIYGNYEEYKKHSTNSLVKLRKMDSLLLKKAWILATHLPTLRYLPIHLTKRRISMRQTYVYWTVGTISTLNPCWHNAQHETWFSRVTQRIECHSCFYHVYFIGMKQTAIRQALETFKGVKRRFEYT
jgi:UDP-N-acetylmuramate--alanine ligase